MSEWIKRDADTRKVFVRTFVSDESDKIDKLVNDFRKEHEIIAVHTHYSVVVIGEKTLTEFCYVAFYKE